MIPRKNADGTFTVCEMVFIMKIGNSEIYTRVRQ